ncbi:MAG: hypothetical protein OXG24_00675 [Gammaproteobacteria bacterium]|nr:hypothetical protein [Gammaproteobacteria bacterium]
MSEADPQVLRALDLMESGDYHELRAHLILHPILAKYRDDSNATLLIKLIDYPGNRPNAAKSARVLLIAGCDVDARRDSTNGTALSGALSTGEADVARVLLEFGANFRAKLGFKEGDIVDFALEICGNDSNEEDGFAQEVRQLLSDFTAVRLD